jgi:Fe-S-cluster-containing dehydrogenase component
MGARDKRYVIVIDLDLCVGCRGCEVACRQEHDLKPRINERVDLKTQRIPHWTEVKTVGPVGIFPDVDLFYFPRMCNHCTDAPCVAECPTGAMTQREDGVVYTNEKKCIACLKCLEACPFQAIFYDKEEESVSKCNLCLHLIDNGLDPACVATCMTRCRIFGDGNDPESPPSQVLKKKREFLMPLPVPWGTTAKPNVFYIRKKSKT